MSTQLLEKFSTLDKAIEYARAYSKSNAGHFHVIESKGHFYVDENGLIRNWETLHKVFSNGKIVK